MAGEETSSAAVEFGSPSKKRRKSDSRQFTPHTPLSTASTTSSLNALADATVSLAAAEAVPTSGPSTAIEQSTVIERMQRQLDTEREAREAAESETRRLEEHVQRLEQSNKQHQKPHSAHSSPHSAPATPPQSVFAASPSNGSLLHSTPSSTLATTSSASPLSASDGGLAGRSVVAVDAGKLYPSASDDESDAQRGVSCHQCKSNKPKHLLLFCTTKADSSGRKRRCRKKYCQSTSP